MFGWFKKDTPPVTCSANPGKAVTARVAFSNSGRNWTEEVDVVSCLDDELKSAGHTCVRQKSWIELNGGFILQPRFLSLHLPERGGVQTVTTIEVSHPVGAPPGIFEFQHAAGETTRKSISQGFHDWLTLDLPVFLDAVMAKPKFCTAMEATLPADGAGSPQRRRAILGPVSHLVTRPAAGPEKHPFCPCCLVTNTPEIMKEKLLGRGFYAIRLFATRQPDGSAAADCRVNGQDWEAGKVALIKYVDSWPHRGVEFRKQCVIIQDQSAIA